MDNQKPIPTEIAFGDPEVHEKAAAKVAEHEYCEHAEMHCPHRQQGRCILDYCPMDEEQL